jgi:hypothetical protein
VLQLAEPGQHVGLAEAVAHLSEKGAGLVIGRPRLLVAAQQVLQLAEPGQHVGLAEAVAHLPVKGAGLVIGHPRLLVAAP